MRVWAFDREDKPGNPLIVDEHSLRSIIDELKNSDEGDCYTVRIKDMTKEEWEALPEWEGW